MSHCPCHTSHVTYQVSHVTCDMWHVTCHMSNLEHLPVLRAPREGRLGPRSTLKNYIKRGHQTDKRTSQLYERIVLGADSLKMSFQKRNTMCFEKIWFKKLPPSPSYPFWIKSQQNIFLTMMASQRTRPKLSSLGASLISSSTPWQAKGDHKVKPGEVSWPRWARARATN